MNIIKRIWLIPTFSSIVIILFLIGMFVVVWYSNSASARLLNISQSYQPILNSVAKIEHDLLAIAELLEDAVVTHDADMIEEAKLKEKNLIDTLYSLSEIDRSRASLLEHHISHFLPNVFRMTQSMLSAPNKDISDLILQVVDGRNELFNHITDYKQQVESELSDTVVTTRDDIQNATTTVTLFVVFASTIMGLGTIIIIRSTSAQLQGLLTFAKEVEKGNYNFQVESGRNSEFSSVINALNSMANSIKSSTEQLNRMAHYDSLTGVPNRRAITERLRSEIKSVERHKYPLSFCMCDIDKFKDVNDGFGHQVGDIVISEFAKILKEKVRTEDIVGRYGGDEFCIILPHTDAEAGLIALERIRISVNAHQFYTDDDKPFNVTGSFGITEFQNGDDLATLVKRADDALYLSKESGRNKISIKTT